MTNKKEKTEEISIRFTHDPEASSPKEMPSISRLLNRKKLNISTSSTSQPPAPPSSKLKLAEEPKAPTKPKAQASAPLEINFNIPGQNPTNLEHQEEPKLALSTAESTSDAKKTDSNATIEKSGPPKEISIAFEAPDEPQLAVNQTSTPAVSAPVPARRRADRTKQQRDLIHWAKESLQTTKDPLGKGLLHVINQGAHSALYLSIHSPPKGKTLPVFQGIAVYADEEMKTFWRGINWDPSVAPEIWKDFLKNGIFEASPHAQSGDAQLIRKAFGTKPADWLYLARVGPVQSCRGMLVILSQKEIMLSLQKALSGHFSTPTTKPKAA